MLPFFLKRLVGVDTHGLLWEVEGISLPAVFCLTDRVAFVIKHEVVDFAINTGRSAVVDGRVSNQGLLCASDLDHVDSTDRHCDYGLKNHAFVDQKFDLIAFMILSVTKAMGMPVVGFSFVSDEFGVAFYHF